MAVLTDDKRRAIYAKYMSDKSAVRELIPLKKSELKAAVDAVDNWIDANAGSFNSALPEPAKSALTAKQKADLLMRVITKRFEVA